MAGPMSGSSLLAWIGLAVLAGGAAVTFGYWVYAITTAEDMPLPLMVALLAVPVGVSVLLIAVLRDRIAQKKRENFLEVDN